jgi:hypothetical protein
MDRTAEAYPRLNKLPIRGRTRFRKRTNQAPTAQPLENLARGAPLGAAANPSAPVVVLLSIPVAIIRPDLAKFLWLLVFISGLALRGLEPADEESATIDELGS